MINWLHALCIKNYFSSKYSSVKIKKYLNIYQVASEQQ